MFQIYLKIFVLFLYSINVLVECDHDSKLRSSQTNMAASIITLIRQLHNFCRVYSLFVARVASSAPERSESFLSLHKAKSSKIFNVFCNNLHMWVPEYTWAEKFQFRWADPSLSQNFDNFKVFWTKTKLNLWKQSYSKRPWKKSRWYPRDLTGWTSHHHLSQSE